LVSLIRVALAGISNTTMVDESFFAVCQELTDRRSGRVSQAGREQGFAVLSFCSAQQHAVSAGTHTRAPQKNGVCSAGCDASHDDERGWEGMPRSSREWSVTIVTIHAILAAPPGAIGVGLARLEIQVSAIGRRRVLLCERFSSRRPLHFFRGAARVRARKHDSLSHSGKHG
jgi:hypothetical protein